MFRKQSRTKRTVAAFFVDCDQWVAVVVVATLMKMVFPIEQQKKHQELKEGRRLVFLVVFGSDRQSSTYRLGLPVRELVDVAFYVDELTTVKNTCLTCYS